MNPARGRAATVQPHREITSQADHVVGQFLSGHAHGQVTLPSIDFHQIQIVPVPADRGARISNLDFVSGDGFSVLHQGGAAANGRCDSVESRRSGS